MRRLAAGRSTVRDRGAAVSEFVMIATLLIFLLFAVLQVAVFFYDRSIVAASAADAARSAAAVGAAQDGPQRAAELIRQRLGASASDITCTGGAHVDAASGLPVSTVHCTGRVHALFAPLRLPLSIDVTSSVLQEHVP